MPAQPALRIVLFHKGNSFHVESVTRVQKLIPPSDSLEETRGEAGSWVVIQDSRGRPVFRRIIRDPLGPREVFTGEEREIRQVDVSEPTGVITLLLPELSDAEKLVLYASGPEREKGSRPAEPVFEVSLKERSARRGNGESGHER